MKMHYKRIMGLLIIALVVFISNTLSVSAKTCEEWKSMDRQDLGDFFVKKYGIEYGLDSDGKNVTIKMTEKKYKNTKKYEFVVTRLTAFKYTKDKQESVDIENVDDIGKKYISSKNKILSYGNDIQIDYKSLVGTDYYAIKVELKPKGFEDSDLKKDCEKATDGKTVIDGFSFTLAITAGTGEKTWEVSSPGKTTTSCKKVEEGGTGQIDCDDYENRYKDHSSFEYKFCYIKAKATATNDEKNGHTRVFDFGDLGDEENFYDAYKKSGKKLEEFKCDYKTIVEAKANENGEYINQFNEKNPNGYYSEKNTQYFFGTASYEKKVGDYEFYYEKWVHEHSGSSYKVPIKCNITCDEVVIAEYGPPVATKAGFCFEYRVKVTSYVNCYDDADKNDKDKDKPGEKCQSSVEPPEGYKVCIPYPTCKLPEGGLTSHRQGGPNDKFDTCIKSCDNGKYTDKCVTTCYNKIYKNNFNKKTNTLSYESSIKKIADDSKNKNETLKDENGMEIISSIISNPKYEL